jgi:uncharacterized cupredoxin-like copper-binding protein
MSKQKTVLLVVIVIIVFVLGIIIGGIACLKKQSCTPFGISESGESIVTTFPVALRDWQNPEKPRSSLPMEEKDIPKEAIRISVSAQGFSPSSFEVKKGEKVVLALTSQDKGDHVFKLKDETLVEVVVGVGLGETKAITFYAPKEAGEYEFYCDVPGHERRGEKGKMIVK